ncbi:hypothetical protein HYU07_01610 [Candidatus Woesearchaeota archaeon]|nr:hypothetical protein [Candidatus Woesearchaeota archaeon]
MKTAYKTIDVYIFNEILDPSVSDVPPIVKFYQKNIKPNLEKEQRGDVLAILKYQYPGSDQACFSFYVYSMDNRRTGEFTGVSCGGNSLTDSPRSQIPRLNIVTKNIRSYFRYNVEAGESPTAIVFKDYLDKFKKATEKIGIKTRIHKPKNTF